MILISIASLCVHGQVLKGVVKDAETGEILPYAHIYLPNSNVGEVGTKDGTFTIDITSAKDTDTLLVRFIGYADQAILISSIESDQQLIVKMNPSFFELSSVTITDKEQYLVVGNKRKSSEYTGWGDFESSRGRARGQVIDNIPCPSRVKSIGFRLKHNDWDSVAFRVNFYLIKDNKIDSTILHKDIIIIESGSKEWSEFPLDSYHIILCDDILVVLEWVDAWGPTGNSSNLLTFSISNKTGMVYRRNKNQLMGRLREEKGIPSIYLELYD